MKSGLGIRPELFSSVSELKPELGFLEAHSENYFGKSVDREWLLDLRREYSISLHGVGLSLGRADDLDRDHLRQLQQLVEEVNPLFVSEHLAWSAYKHQHLPDLLPLPLTDESVRVVCEHIDQMQQAIGRQILLENPSNYLLFDTLQIAEPDFLNTVCHQTGCGVLLDINNVYVSSQNLQRSAHDFLAAIDTGFVHQFHLAGHTEVKRDFGKGPENILIDTHNQTVSDDVWKLFRSALDRFGGLPTLIEWDSDFPSIQVLLSECEKANHVLESAAPSVQGTFDGARPTPPSPFQRKPFKNLGQFQSEFLSNVLELESATRLVDQKHQQRISVYQNNVFGALKEYLAEVYPATKGVLGQRFFEQLVLRAVQKTPPSVGDVHRYGEELIAAIGDFDSLKELPYLKELMQLEWVLHGLYFRSPTEIVDWSEIPQDKLMEMKVRPSTGYVILSSTFPLYEIWRQSLPNYHEPVAINLADGPDTLLLSKDDQGVHCQKITSEIERLLVQIDEDENLLQAIESLSGSIGPEQLSSALAFIFEASLIAPKELSKVEDSNDDQSELLTLH